MTYFKTILIYLGGLLLVNLTAYSFTTIVKAYETDENVIYQQINDWVESPEHPIEESTESLANGISIKGK